MPVTVRLSRLFHERLGDEIADELASWFNQVDATYRGDLRDLNELNFARFDAKLEQRVTHVEARFDQRITELEARVDQRITELEARVSQRITELEAKLSQRITTVEAKLSQRIAEVEARIEQSADRLRAEFTSALADVRSRLMTWMVGLWITSVLGFASVLVAVVRLR